MRIIIELEKKDEKKNRVKEVGGHKNNTIYK